MPSFSVNTDALVGFANKLEKISKNDLPRVVKKTLDNTAKDVKKVTMPATVRRTFTQRSISKNFYKANSQIDFSVRRPNINSMESSIGFLNVQGKFKSTEQAVQNLEQQEHGGTIKGRAFIPLTRMRGGRGGARVSGRLNKRVGTKNVLSKVNNVANQKDSRAKTKKGRFVQTVIHVGVGGHFISENGTLFRVIKASQNIKNRRLNIKLLALYDYEKNRSVKVKGRRFMRIASDRSMKKMDGFFIEAAKEQFDFRGL